MVSLRQPFQAVTFEPAVECGCISIRKNSVTGEDEYFPNDRRMLASLVAPPATGTDLFEGWQDGAESWQLDSGYMLSHIAAWIQAEMDKGMDLRDAVQGCGVVTRRGVLNRFARIAYFHRDTPVQLAALKWKGVVFLTTAQDPTEARKLISTKLDYAGPRFEELMSAANGGRQAFHPCDGFYSVTKCRIDGNDVLIAGEIDAIDDATGEYVEIFTSQVRYALDNALVLGTRTAAKKYFQCWLSNIKQTSVAFHDNGILISVKNPQPDSLLVGYRFAPQIGINLIGRLLKYLRATIPESQDADNMRIFVSSVRDGSLQFHEKDQQCFLPQSFLVQQ